MALHSVESSFFVGILLYKMFFLFTSIFFINTALCHVERSRKAQSKHPPEGYNSSVIVSLQ